MSELSKYIKQLKREIKFYKKLSQKYKDFYHGTRPPTHISVDRSDYIKIINELRKLRKESEKQGILKGTPAIHLRFD